MLPEALPQNHYVCKTTKGLRENQDLMCNVQCSKTLDQFGFTLTKVLD